MKQIIAITLGVMILGTDPAEAKSITGEIAETIVLRGKVVRRDAQIKFGTSPQPLIADEIHYDRRVYWCTRRISKSRQLLLYCYDTDE